MPKPDLLSSGGIGKQCRGVWLEGRVGMWPYQADSANRLAPLKQMQNESFFLKVGETVPRYTGMFIFLKFMFMTANHIPLQRQFWILAEPHQLIQSETGLIFNSIRRDFTIREYEMVRSWQSTLQEAVWACPSKESWALWWRVESGWRLVGEWEKMPVYEWEQKIRTHAVIRRMRARIQEWCTNELVSVSLLNF